MARTDATAVAPTIRRARKAGPWAVGDRVRLRAGVNDAFREGTSVRIIVRDTSALPDAVVATLPGTVERQPDGKLQAVAEWDVAGRARTRQQNLKLEFQAVGRGIKSEVGHIEVKPARLVQVEIGAGGEVCGAVTLNAGKRVYAVETGRATAAPAVRQGRRIEFEIPLDYHGVLTIEQGGRPLVRVDLSRVPGQDTIKLKLASAGRQITRPAPVMPTWNRPDPPPPVHQPRPLMTAPDAGAAGPFPGVPGGDVPLLYVCELQDAGPLTDLVDGRLYTTDRASDAKLKKLHDTLIGATTELLDKETLHALKLNVTKFTLTTQDGQRVLIVEGNRALRKRLARVDAAVRQKAIAGGTEFAQGLTRGASAGAGSVVRRSFLALKGKGAWLGVLIVGSAEALYSLSQGAPMLDVLDVFGMTMLKGALGMVLGTALVGVTLAAGAGVAALLGTALVISTGGMVVLALVAGIAAGLLLDSLMPQSQISDLMHDFRNTAERWLHDFDDSLDSFQRWASAAFGGPSGTHAR